MSSRTAFGAVSFLIFSVLVVACSQGGGTAPGPPETAGAPAAAAAAPETPLFTGGANQMDVTLFFLRTDGEALAPEARRIFRTATVNDRARQALQALFGGSEGGLAPSVPPGTSVRELYLGGDGTAYVDLSPEFKGGLEQGSEDAVNAVYAVVNTLTYNFSEIQKVKILVDGDEVDDVGGHLNLSHPLFPEMGFVATGSPRPRPARAPVPAEPPSQDRPPDPNAPAKPADDKPSTPADTSPFRL